MALKDYDSMQLGEMFHYLDDLRAGGRINMFGARPYLAEEFGLDREESQAIMVAWQTTFDPEQKPEDRASEALEQTA